MTMAGACRSRSEPSPQSAIVEDASANDAQAEDEVITVKITKTTLLLEETPLLDLPPRDELVASGLPARYKRTGPNELFVVPLADALTKARNARKPEAPPFREAIVAADPSTPYRLLVEVLYTLGQSKFGRYHLLVLGEQKREPPFSEAPLGPRLSLDHTKPLHLAAFITDDGVSLKTSSAYLATGCRALGKGNKDITIPKRGAQHDLSALSACARRIKVEFRSENEVTIAANPGIDFQTVVDVMDALRVGQGEDLFPDVHFGIAR